MKQQTTALILSALLLSTLAHGPIGEKQNRANNVEHSRHHPSHLLRQHFRDNDNQQCRWVCQDPGSGNGVSVIVNTTSSIIAIVNSTAHVAWAIDVQAHLVAVFNGTSGSVVVVNIREGTGVYIREGVSKETWNSSQRSFQLYISSLTSLKIVYELGVRVGVTFTRTTVSKAALEVIAGVLIHLSAEYAVQLRSSSTTSLKLLLEISQRVSILFRTSLVGFLSLIESTVVLIRFDIQWFVGVLEGLGELFSEIRGGIKFLTEKSVKLDLKAILVARTGIDVFVLIVTVLLERNIDVAEVLGGALSSGERLISILVRLGGSVSFGVTGLLKVVGAIIGVIHERVKIQVLIDILIEYSAYNTDGNSLREELKAAIRALIRMGEKINSSESLDICWSFLKKLRDHQLVVNGVNVASIIVVLLKVGTISGLEVIVRSLMLMSAVVKVQVAIAYLALGLIIRLNTAIGIGILRLLITSLKIDASILAAGEDYLHLILKGTSESAIKGINQGNWSNIPIINTIFSSLSVAVKSGSDGKLTFQAIFTSSETTHIRTWIVTGLIAEWKGSGKLTWDISSDDAANTTITAITDDGSSAATEERETASERISTTSEVAGVTEIEKNFTAGETTGHGEGGGEGGGSGSWSSSTDSSHNSGGDGNGNGDGGNNSHEHGHKGDGDGDSHEHGKGDSHEHGDGKGNSHEHKGHGDGDGDSHEHGKGDSHEKGKEDSSHEHGHENDDKRHNPKNRHHARIHGLSRHHHAEAKHHSHHEQRLHHHEDKNHQRKHKA